jgi:hypothetical protein
MHQSLKWPQINNSSFTNSKNNEQQYPWLVQSHHPAVSYRQVNVHLLIFCKIVASSLLGNTFNYNSIFISWWSNINDLRMKLKTYDLVKVHVINDGHKALGPYFYELSSIYSSEVLLFMELLKICRSLVLALG